MVHRLALTIALVLIAAPAHAQEDYVLLKTFTVEPPYTISVRPSPLVLGSDGNFYGQNGHGFFRVTPDGSFSALGPALVPAMAIDGGDGYYYTVTRPLEGTAIVKFTADGSQTILYQFTHASQGSLNGRIVQGTDGQLYGAIRINDGSLFSARLFRLTTDGTFTTLHEFPWNEGATETQLIRGRDGHFYGTTWGGLGFGRVYRMAASGTVTTVHAFTGGAGGATPQPFLAEGSDGSLYGATMTGGTAGRGVAFRILPGGGFVKLHDYASEPANGVTPPTAPFLEGSDGNLYGTSDFAIYRLTTTGDLRVLHSNALAYPGWAGSDRYGTFFKGVLEGTGGNMYGSATNFGPGGDGAIFRLNRQRVACVNDIKPIWQDYNGGTLYLVGAVKSETPALYATWMIRDGVTTPLWASITPALDPTVAFELAGPVPAGSPITISSLVITSTLNVCPSSQSTPAGTVGSGGS